MSIEDLVNLEENQKYIEDVVWKFELLRKERDKNIRDIKQAEKQLYHQFQLEFEKNFNTFKNQANRKLDIYKRWIEIKLNNYTQLDSLILEFEEKNHTE